MKVTLEFENRHHYIQEYTFSEADYCPGCGSTGTVWEEVGRGDYDLGPHNLCTHCNCSFTIQMGKAESEYLKIIEQLKTGKQITPTTPPGN